MSDARRPQRLHIGLFGRRNAGKSSLCNALCGQDAALVSPVPGTTTDPVEKVMELAPLGPVVLLDTPGLDDAGELGAQRVARSLRTLEEVDVALIVLEDQRWGAPERELAALLKEADVPFGIVCNCRDGATEQAARQLGPEAFALPASVPLTVCRLDGAATPTGALAGVRELLVRLRPQEEEPPLLRDLLPPRGRLILVCPQDGSAPKGRLIMPQVQAIRDALDGDALCLVVTDKAFGAALDSLREPPQLIVCDSQVIAAVAAIAPAETPLTTFSVLMARLKGDLPLLARGAAALHNLRPGDTVLIQEACSHHPQADDIGRVKIPRLLARLAGGELDCRLLAGRHWQDYAAAPRPRAVVHCGGCTLSRRQMTRRLITAQRADLPMTNYGMAISLAQGVLERVLSPFPEALAAYREACLDQNLRAGHA